MSLNTLNTTDFKDERGFVARYSLTVATAISAASLFGKRNSPVEMQQKAIDFNLFRQQDADNSYNTQLTGDNLHLWGILHI